MKMAGFMRGALMGVAVGAALGIAFDPLSDGKRRRLKKNANRMMYTMKGMVK